MSKHDSSLSKDQFNLLKAFKKQISNPQSSAVAKQAESKKTQVAVEELEDTEFEPMFSACESKLSGKKIALFGSYGWGDGEWMRTWEESCKRERMRF